MIIAVVALVLGLRGGTSAGTPPPSSTPSPSPVVPLASADNAHGQVIDGVQCQTGEQLVYHIHAHLAVFVGGKARRVPHGVGITPPLQLAQTTEGPYVTSGSCFYWLHTHTDDGIIHIESPAQTQYTLGQFFAIWGQPLSSTQVGPAAGRVSAYVNGQPFAGDPSTIPLTDHAVIQLDVGTVVAPRPFTFPVGIS